jgi:hypothetical protein
LGGLSAAGAGALFMHAAIPAIEAPAITSAMLALFFLGTTRTSPPSTNGARRARCRESAARCGRPGCAPGRSRDACLRLRRRGARLGGVYMRQALGTANEAASMGYAVFAGSMALVRMRGRRPQLYGRLADVRGDELGPRDAHFLDQPTKAR